MMKKGQIIDNSINTIFLNALEVSWPKVDTEVNKRWCFIAERFKAALKYGAINFDARPMTLIFSYTIMGFFEILFKEYLPDHELVNYEFWYKQIEPYTRFGDLYELSRDANGVLTKKMYSYTLASMPGEFREQRRQEFRVKMAQRVKLDDIKEENFYDNFDYSGRENDDDDDDDDFWKKSSD